METLTATSARKQLFQLLSNFHKKYTEPVKITSLGGDAILMSDEEYNGMIETINVLQNKYLAKKLVNGINEPLENCIPMDEVF